MTSFENDNTIMKTLCINILILLVFNTSYGQGAFYINSDNTILEAQFNLEGNKEYDFFIKVFLDKDASIRQFKTTLDTGNELLWDISNIKRNEWVELLHSFTPPEELTAPTLKIELINDQITGIGFGDFYIDDISIREKPISGALTVDDTVELLNENNEIIIYPNPSIGNFNIDNFPKDAQLFLYSVLGQSINMNVTNGQFSLGTAQSGMYFLKIVSKNETIIKEIIKK